MKNVFTIAEVVALAEKAATQAYNEVREGQGTEGDAAAAAAVAFRLNLPALTSIGAVQAHLAVLVRGIEMGFLSHRESRLMVATARTWLAAHEACQRAKAVAAA